MGVEPKDKASDIHWMSLALSEAQKAYDANEVPVGAILVSNGTLVAKAYNQPISSNNPTAHAEIEVIRKASELIKNYRLVDMTLYVTLEPCTMCFGAMVHARISRLVYGATEPKAGVIDSQLQLVKQDFYNHKFEVAAGVMASECSELLSRFFAMRRIQKKQEKYNNG